MSKILIIAEQRAGKLKKSTFELVGAASAAGQEVEVVLMGSGIEGEAAAIGQYGASKVHLCDDAALEHYTSEAYSRVILNVAKSTSAEVIMTAHSPTGRDLMPRIARSLDTGMASDCISVDFATMTVKRSVYAGKALAEVEFCGSGPKCLTVRPNTFTAPAADSSKSAEVVKISENLTDLKTKVLEVAAGAGGRLDVTEAPIVVSGGRAMKNAENFAILEKMADTLGAAVGASRAAVDAGYREHKDQVGQTGKVVSPQLYIACGISGAIQHLAGMRTSKTIVAVNTDPEAPIFQLADYGVVGDLFELVPLLTEEFQKVKG